MSDDHNNDQKTLSSFADVVQIVLKRKHHYRPYKPRYLKFFHYPYTKRYYFRIDAKTMIENNVKSKLGRTLSNNHHHSHQDIESDELERIYLSAVERGDLGTVKKLCTKGRLNVNYVDSLGRHALRIAVERDHLEILNFLVGLPSIDLKDSLLHAINENNILAVEIFLRTKSKNYNQVNQFVDFFKTILLFIIIENTIFHYSNMY